MKVNLAYQVYSAREEAEKDLLKVLKALAEMGYDGVEFAGFYGLSADEVEAALKATGLKGISSHVPYDSIVADMEGVIAYHKQIGCEYIAIPYLDEKSRPGGPAFAAAIRNIAYFGKLAKKSGITVLYHNHDFEFEKLSGQYGLDFLYDAIDEECLKTELDTCWVNVAGESPVAYIEKYAGRCPVIHLKDFVGGKKGDEALYALIKEDGSDDREIERKAEPAFDFRPVGYGVQDIPAIVKAGLKAGAKWFVVEQDLSSERPPLDAAKMSCEYVRGID